MKRWGLGLGVVLCAIGGSLMLLPHSEVKSVSITPTAVPTVTPTETPTPTPTAAPTVVPVVRKTAVKPKTKPSPKTTPGPERKSYVGKKWIGLQEGWSWPLDVRYEVPSKPGHFGMDMVTEEGCGNTVFASSDGVVLESLLGGWNGGYGKTVLIDHGNNQYTRYAHLGSVYVSKGQSISRHQALGVIGNTGNSTGCHLHFEAFSM